MNFLRTIISTLIPSFTKPKSRTVRFMFPMLFGFVILLGANIFSATESSYIRLEADQAAIRSGERFTLSVFANAHVPVNAVDVTLSFNSQDFEVLSVDRGQSVLTIWTEEPVVSNNSVTLSGGTFRKGFLGEHLLATLELRAKRVGQGSLSTDEVVFLAGDGRGTEISVSETDNSDISLYIYDEDSSPDDIGAKVEVRVLTDIDGDGNVSLKDISSFMSAWTSKTIVHDFNGDGRMTFRDFSIILAAFFTQ